MLTIGIIFAVLLVLSLSLSRRGQDYNPGCVLVNDCLAIRPPNSDLDLNSLTFGFLGISLKGLVKGIGSVVGAVGSVAKVIPGVGGAIAAGASAVSSVLGGGTATAKTKAGTTTVIGTVQPGQVTEAGFFSGMMKKGPLGIPIIVYVVGATGLVYIILKKKRII